MPKEKTAKPKTGILNMKEISLYLTGAVGSGMIFSIMSSLITDFYMNVMQLNWLFVFLLMLLARVWDSFTDPLMGVIMDRSSPKHGKMRSWLFYSPALIMLFTFLMFFIPDVSETQLMVYAAATYVIWGLAFTVADIPFWSLPLAMTPHEKERGKVISLGRTTNGVGAAVPMALFMILGPILAGRMGDPATAATETIASEMQRAIDVRMYMIIALVCAIGGGLLVFLTPFKVKERVPLPKAENKGALRNVLTCKPLMLTALMGILAGGRYMLQAGQAHVARFAFYIGPSLDGMTLTQRNEAIAASMSLVLLVLQLIAAVGMLAAMLAVPFLIGKFSYKQMLIGSCLLGGTAGLVMFGLGPGRFWFAAAMLFLVAIPLGVINTVSFAMVGDALDYMEWEKGYRNNGLGLACQSFVLKFGNAIATSAIVLVYPLVGLDPSESTGRAHIAQMEGLSPAQVNTVQRGFFSIISIIPAISLLISIIPMLFYDLTGAKKELVMRELAERRAAEEEAKASI